MKFYKCADCAKLLAVIDDAKCTPRCCGEPMIELQANTTDGAKEKHVPVYEVSDGKVSVTVGSVEHPMLDAHFIDFVALRTKSGCQVKKLQSKSSTPVKLPRPSLPSSPTTRSSRSTSTATSTVCGRRNTASLFSPGFGRG